MMEPWERNKQAVITEVKVDLVDVWEILRSVERTFPNKDDGWYRAMTLQLIKEILEEESEIYFITLNKGKWHQWQTSPQEVTKYIDNMWSLIGRRPKGTEIGWLSLWPI